MLQYPDLIDFSDAQGTRLVMRRSNKPSIGVKKKEVYDLSTLEPLD